MGNRGTPNKWYESYPEQRSQYIDLNGINSDVLDVARGEPRGSVLGPLLYVMYVNDMHLDGVTTYADDTSLLVSAGDGEGLVDAGRSALKQLCAYFADCGLHFNSSKTVMVDFSISSCETNRSYLVRASDHSIIQTETWKFLGLHLDRFLAWSDHVDYVEG